MLILKLLKIKESETELKKLQRQQPPYLSIRIQMLLLMKRKDLHSKRGLSDILGISANTVQSWKTMYDSGGIKKLLSYNRGGHKQPII